ncbi:MAG: chemotaxis protein CheC [Candidatus Bathyarchaeota archaeon]|nr:chemotaxis protein CheC [Candidatus Bathyarchaeota archaeon]
MKVKNKSSKALEKKKLKILLELGNIGAKHAANSLSKILKQPVTIDVPRVGMIPPGMLPKFYHGQNTPATAVYIHLTENVECHFLFIFEMLELKEITTLMTRSLSYVEHESSIELSAIEELGNILIGSFLTAISDFTGINLVSTPPLLIGAPFDSIISDFVGKLARTTGEALVIDTCFKRKGGYYAPAQLMIFPSYELQELLINSSKVSSKKAGKRSDVELIFAGDLAIETKAQDKTRRKSKVAGEL